MITTSHCLTQFVLWFCLVMRESCLHDYNYRKRSSLVGSTMHWCGTLDYENTQHACINCSQLWMWRDQVSQSSYCRAVILPTVLDCNLEP